MPMSQGEGGESCIQRQIHVTPRQCPRQGGLRAQIHRPGGPAPSAMGQDNAHGGGDRPPVLAIHAHSMPTSPPGIVGGRSSWGAKHTEGREPSGRNITRGGRALSLVLCP